MYEQGNEDEDMCIRVLSLTMMLTRDGHTQIRDNHMELSRLETNILKTLMYLSLFGDIPLYFIHKIIVGSIIYYTNMQSDINIFLKVNVNPQLDFFYLNDAYHTFIIIKLKTNFT